MKKKARILVVDDEAGLRSTLERMLQRDYEVVSAASCEEVPRALGDEPIDLAIVDLVLPDGDGFSLLQQLRQRAELPEVIVITGDTYDADEKLARALRGEAFYFLTKPFDAVALDALVRRSLEVRRLQRALTLRSAQLEKDLQLAREFQHSLMPCRDLQHDGLQVRSMFTPCDDLSGDFFDYRSLGDQVFLIIADVAGHGVAAAMRTGMIASTWSRALREGLALPAILGRFLDLVHDWEDSQFFSTAMVCLNPAAGSLRYLNAGHPTPALRKPDGSLEFLDLTGPIISPAVDEVAIEERELAFEPGASLLAFTDGIVEARSPQGEFFGTDPLWTMLRDLPAHQLLAAMESTLQEHCRGRPQEDDYTALVAFRGP
jgi:sigma-B regulation protein RsbU (phosphoserine phosphatase)